MMIEDLGNDIKKARGLHNFLERKLSLLKISFKIESLRKLQEDKQV